MKICIVETGNLNRNYLGADDRMITMPRIKHLGRREFKQYLEMYFEYIDVIDFSDMDVYQKFKNILPYYNFLKTHNVPCEILLYAEEPQNDFAEKELEYLGMDIVEDGMESLILCWIHCGFTDYLNGNGLCETKEDCQKIIEKNDKMISPVYSSERDFMWEVYYVYRIMC